MSNRPAGILLAVCALGAGAWTLKPADPQPSVAELAAKYRKFQLITPAPLQVNPEFALLCVGPMQSHVDAAREKHGPHAHTAISIYMDDLAADAFRAGNAPYPVGAVIVKQKLLLSYRDASGKPTPGDQSGVGGMVKRPAGFDPEHGDWEYFYLEDPARIERGTIASCVNCHASAKATDHVFGTWQAANP